MSPDRVLYASCDIRIGTFECPVEHPEFRTAGPIEGYTICFPRTAVWIEHEGKRPFVADPGVVTIYNKGQPYVRRALAPDGDRGDWFSVSRQLALAIVAGLDPAADPFRPFPVAFGHSTASTYCRQRRLLIRLRRREIDGFELEQEVIQLIGETLCQAIAAVAGPATTARGQPDLVERARAELARDPFAAPTVREVAARIGASPFHLCRVFRRVTGLTLHQCLLELRARRALERLEAGDRGLSRLAQELGYSSHSHFSAAFRRRMGGTPSRVRTELIG